VHLQTLHEYFTGVAQSLKSWIFTPFCNKSNYYSNAITNTAELIKWGAVLAFLPNDVIQHCHWTLLRPVCTGPFTHLRQWYIDFFTHLYHNLDWAKKTHYLPRNGHCMDWMPSATNPKHWIPYGLCRSLLQTETFHQKKSLLPFLRSPKVKKWACTESFHQVEMKR